MVRKFGAFLIVEIWSAPDHEVASAAEEDDISPTELQPDFVVMARGEKRIPRTISTLQRSLGKIVIARQRASAIVDSVAKTHPPGMPYLLSDRELDRLKCETVGIQIRPIYRDHDTREVYPAILRLLKRKVGASLKQAFFVFVKTRTSATPEHYYSLGRRAMVKAVWEVDRRLSEVGESFDFLLQVTPVNSEASWKEFRRRKFAEAPQFYYRPLSLETAELKRRLHEIPIERIEDPTLAELFRQRQDELDRKITMLNDIGTPKFLLGSLQVYGRPDTELSRLARQLLEELPSRSRQDAAGGSVSSEAFAQRAEEEFSYYRQQSREFDAKVIVRDDMYSGLMCSGGHLYIGQRTTIPTRRINALLQHEVGTHLLTYFNGKQEPFHQLHSGFAGYDGLQEGLAVLTEYLVGGLSVPRLRILAARVVATDLLIGGLSFGDCFRILDIDYDFSQRAAYTITMRVFRGGGLTKDAVYLRGLVDILKYLRNGGDLQILFVGKIALEHVPFITELYHRKVIKPPVLQPRYLEMPGVNERLAAIQNGNSVLDLVKGHFRCESRS